MSIEPSSQVDGRGAEALVPANLAAELTRERERIAGDDHVEIRTAGLSEQRIAHRAADDPRVAAGPRSTASATARKARQRLDPRGEAGFVYLACARSIAQGSRGALPYDDAPRG